MCDKREGRLIFLGCLVLPDRPNEPDELSPIAPVLRESGGPDRGPEFHNDPQDQHDEKDQHHNGPDDDAGHIEPGLLCFSVGLCRSSSQKFCIPRVTTEPKRKEVTDNGDGADGSIDEEIQAHPCNDDLRHVKPRGQYQDRCPNEIGQDVAKSRYQPKQRIEPHIEGGAGDLDGCIQNLG